MIAALGMYDRAEVAPGNDALWAAIRARLGYGPQRLDRTTGFNEIWQSPDLLLSQTCGMPYRCALHGRVALVGTPDYGLPGMAPGYYHSVMVVRAGDVGDVADYRDRVLAYNGPVSQSGWAAPQNMAAGLGFGFERLHCSGGHLASARAVADGVADIAALDALSWDMICEFDDLAGQLDVIAQTDPTPGLPLITAPGRDVAAISEAVEFAIDAIGAEHRKALRLKGLARIRADEYLAVATPAAP